MYAVWLLPKEEDSKYLSNILDKLSKKYEAPQFQPHVTVYGVVDTTLPIVEKVVKDIIVGLKEFKVKKNGLHYLDNIWKSLYIDLDYDADLAKINKLLSAKLSQYGNYDFEPHISLIYKKMDNDEKLKIIGELDIQNEFILNALAIIQYSDDVSTWKPLRIFTFPTA